MFQVGKIIEAVIWKMSTAKCAKYIKTQTLMLSLERYVGTKPRKDDLINVKGAYKVEYYYDEFKRSF